MSRARHALFAALLIWTYCCAEAHAQTATPEQKIFVWLARTMTTSAVGDWKPGSSIEDIRKSMLRVFARMDIDGGGLSESDYALKEQIDLARLRSGILRFWLDADLDGDGNLSEAELKSYYGWVLQQRKLGMFVPLMPDDVPPPDNLEPYVRGPLNADSNDDGVASFFEILDSVNSMTASARFPPREYQVLPSLALDSDGDGVVTEQEFAKALDHALADIDTDHDGVLSAAEVDPYQQRFREAYKLVQEAEQPRHLRARYRAQAIRCHLPRASDEAKIVLLSVFGGLATATVDLGGADDPTEMVDVWIEPGPTPLYLLLAGYRGMVWRFHGQVERVVMAVADANTPSSRLAPRVGVIGLPRDRVYITPEKYCLRQFDALNASGEALKAMPFLLGRSPDQIVVKKWASRVELPAGRVEVIADLPDRVPPSATGLGQALWNALLARYPSGVVRINPSEVISRVSVTDRGPPKEAGAAELLEAGALRPLTTRKTTNVDLLMSALFIARTHEELRMPADGPNGIFELPTSFVILKKIRIPKGYGDRANEVFRLAPGVPEPDGAPGPWKVEQ